MSARLTAYIAILVSVVWAVSFIADILIPTYDPSPFVHLAMMTVVGAAFSHTVLRRNHS